MRLAVDVHVPKGLATGERTATILHMSRYYRSVDIRGPWRPFLGFGIYPITERDIREQFVKAGYSWVDVDLRGASFGHREYPLSAEEVRDGADLLDWIAESKKGKVERKKWLDAHALENILIQLAQSETEILLPPRDWSVREPRLE